MLTQYFIINADHDVIIGVSDVTYFSFTNKFVEASEQQLARYYALSEFLPEDTYLQLSDLTSPDKKQQPVDKTNHKQANASPEFRNSIANMFKTKGK